MHGVKDAPLLTCVNVDRYVLPLLHILLGVGNRILNNYFNYIDQVVGLEKTPPDVQDKRNNYYIALANLTDHKDAIELWNELGGKRLADLRISRQMLNTMIAQLGRYMEAEEKKAHLADKQDTATEIDALVAQKKDMQAEEKVLRVAVRDAKKAMDDTETTYQMRH